VIEIHHQLRSNGSYFFFTDQPLTACRYFPTAYENSSQDPGLLPSAAGVD
jgi:hypothetical protein